ncbi:hypothetical protein IDD99_002614 [Enterococcus faecium]|uniref:WxL domain-containing protein n=1 Tax=Enterococcus faecium TaxID=1352 RepID=UPI000813CA7F|nr:WxL domain-containing protein [Enterococcus faecium]EGO9937585.1 hypothetical protein [Enterococcus faecium]
MPSRLRRMMLFLGTTILVIQAVFMPIGMFSAETIMEIEEQGNAQQNEKQEENPPVKNSLEEDSTEDSRFFFNQSQFQGMAKTPLQIKFFSDQEVSEARVILPEEATIIKEQLPAGTSVEEGEKPYEWLIQSEHAQTTFALPVVFNTAGNYELSVEESTLHLEISECEESSDDNSSSPDIDQTLNTDIKTERNVTNLLINPNFTFNRGVETTIPHWELASSTTPVNILSRDLTISQETSSKGWNRLSDSTFQIGSALQVNRLSGDRTLIVSQTIQTVSGHTYDIQVNAKRISSTGNLTITAYNGSGVIAGPNSLKTTSYSLDSNYETYGIRFTANSDQTTIGFRLDGTNTIMTQASVTPVQYSLKLESLPSVGGNAQADVDLLTQGQTTTIVATSNPGYRFVGWQANTGTNVVISDPSATNTTITMGNSDVTLQAIFEKEGRVFVNYIDSAGNKLADSKELRGAIGESYETSALEIENYKLTEEPKNAQGIFTEEAINVTYIYDISQVSPIDPLDPDSEVDPENKPELPEDQGFLSIDFASQFNFGTQKISVSDQIYYAQSQRLLNENGTVNETEERPNYVQISDRRPVSERNGWQLSVTQNGQFRNESGHELIGSEIQLFNQELVTAQGGTIPELQEEPVQQILPNTRKVLIQANGESGTGTWIYRLGNQQTANKSVGLYVPKGTNPEATNYSTKLTWELSSIPDN